MIRPKQSTNGLFGMNFAIQSTLHWRTQMKHRENSLHWIRYFHRNRSGLRQHPWNSSCRLSPTERERIANSLRVFQLGESSEGKHLLQATAAFASRSGDPGLLEAMRMFIAEEQRHARDLGRFLILEQIPLAEKH